MLSQSQVLEDWTEFILKHTIDKTMSNTTGTYDWSANFRENIIPILYKNDDVIIRMLT